MIEKVLLNYISSYYLEILILVGIFVIAAISLDIINGYAGQFSIGHAGFMAIGAYTAAYLTVYKQTPFFLALLAGSLFSSLAGLIVGFPALRLRGDYLAIATLGFAEIIRVFFVNFEPTGGARGLAGIPRYANFDWVFALTILSFLVLYFFTRSSFGRSLEALREDEVAAACIGIPTTRYKVLAFVIASFFAGLSGGLFAHSLLFIDPSSFGLLRSIEVLLMIVLGGMGSLWGAVFGAVVLTLLPEALRDYGGIMGTLTVVLLFGFALAYSRTRNRWRFFLSAFLSFIFLFLLGYFARDFIVTYVSQMRMIVYSLLLIILMIFRPQGLMGRFKFKLPFLGREK